MADRYCTACASIVPGDSRFCPRCGAALPVPSPPPVWGSHPAWRFQVDPNDPPYRDTRWVQLVLGFALAMVGGFLLIVWGIVSGVAKAPTVIEYVFLVPGGLCLAVGILLVLVALRRTLGPPRP